MPKKAYWLVRPQHLQKSLFLRSLRDGYDRFFCLYVDRLICRRSPIVKITKDIQIKERAISLSVPKGS